MTYEPKYFVIDVNPLSNKQELIMDSIKSFFIESNVHIFLPILTGNTKISLRIIDWFVTNYSKKNNINYVIEKNKDSEETILFNVFINYKLQLKAYTKKQFDPFCRRNRIKFIYNDKGEYIITTVGQLNFFKWAIENKIIDYIVDHLQEIDKDMNINIKKVYKTKKNKNIDSDVKSLKVERKKRRELSVSAIKQLNKQKHSFLLDFN